MKKLYAMQVQGQVALLTPKEHECQQKMLHFSSQNLVNVAWAFAKALSHLHPYFAVFS